VNFTWDALAGAQSAYNRLTNFVLSLNEPKDGAPAEEYIREFTASIDDDLNTASAIALLWKLVKDTEVDDKDKYATLLKIDEVLGLGLRDFHTRKQNDEVPEAVMKLINARSVAREEKDYAASDRLRDEIKNLGYEVKDTSLGQKLEKI
jgi:cysteinyl-tRNA synthetase